MPNQNPEQLARDRIDAALRQCGWTIQDKKKINLVSANLPNALGAGATQLHILRNTFGLIEPELPLAYFKSPNFISNGTKKKTGSALQKRAPTDYFSSNPFPLFPIKEQRIVKKIDQLMSRCDHLEKLRADRSQKRLDMHTTAIRKMPDAPDQKTFEDAWQFITRHFGDLYTARENRAELRKAILQFAVMGKLVKLESTISHIPRKELTSKIGSGSIPSGGKNAYHNSGTPLIRSMNVHFGGFVYNGLAFINDAQAKKLNNVIVQADDVLLNITGASIGRVAIAPPEMNGARVNQHVCILRTKDKLIPQFLEIFLASPLIQNWIQDIQVGATREALTKAKIEEIKVPVPSVADQIKMIRMAKKLLGHCNDLERQIDMLGEKQMAVLGTVMEGATF